MTPAEFKAGRHALDLTVTEAAEIFGIDARTLRRWEDEAGDRPPHPTAVRVMAWMLAGLRPPQWPAEGGGQIGALTVAREDAA